MNERSISSQWFHTLPVCERALGASIYIKGSKHIITFFLLLLLTGVSLTEGIGVGCVSFDEAWKLVSSGCVLLGRILVDFTLGLLMRRLNIQARPDDAWIISRPRFTGWLLIENIFSLKEGWWGGGSKTTNCPRPRTSGRNGNLQVVSDLFRVFPFVRENFFSFYLKSKTTTTKPAVSEIPVLPTIEPAVFLRNNDNPQGGICRVSVDKLPKKGDVPNG
jgi:hypothetical protein